MENKPIHFTLKSHISSTIIVRVHFIVIVTVNPKWRLQRHSTEENAVPKLLFGQLFFIIFRIFPQLCFSCYVHNTFIFYYVEKDEKKNYNKDIQNLFNSV